MAPPRFHAPPAQPMHIGKKKKEASPYAHRRGDPDEGRSRIGRIADVDIKKRTAKVIAGDVTAPAAAWTTPYCHSDGEYEGFDAIPRRGSMVILTKIQGNYYITGFLMPHLGTDQGNPGGGMAPDHRGPRPEEHEEGDVFIGSSDGNHVGLTNDGAVIMHSHPLAELLLEPLRQMARFFLTNYEQYVSGGFIKWLEERDPIAKSNYTQMWKTSPDEGMDDQVLLLVGADAGVYRMQVWSRPAPQAPLEVKHNVHIDKLGNMTVETAGNLIGYVGMNAQVTVQGNTQVNCLGNLHMTVGGNAVFSVDGNVVWSVGGNERHDVSGESSVDAVGPVQLKGQLIKLN